MVLAKALSSHRQKHKSDNGACDTAAASPLSVHSTACLRPLHRMAPGTTTPSLSKIEFKTTIWQRSLTPVPNNHLRQRLARLKTASEPE
jgi:hypothetical protein